MDTGEWIEVASLEPTEPGRNRSREVPDVLTAWLAERGLVRSDLRDEDIQVRLHHLGPADGRCTVQILVRSDAPPLGNAGSPAT